MENNYESLFIKVDELGEPLGISWAEAYRSIKKGASFPKRIVYSMW